MLENSPLRSVYFEHVLMNDGWEPKSEIGKGTCWLVLKSRKGDQTPRMNKEEWREMQKIKAKCSLLFHMPS